MDLFLRTRMHMDTQHTGTEGVREKERCVFFAPSSLGVELLVSLWGWLSLAGDCLSLCVTWPRDSQRRQMWVRGAVVCMQWNTCLPALRSCVEGLLPHAVMRGWMYSHIDPFSCMMCCSSACLCLFFFLSV